MYKVFGYDFECYNFERNFISFVAACKAYLKHDSDGDVVFIEGVSPKVEKKLRDMFFTQRRK